MQPPPFFPGDQIQLLLSDLKRRSFKQTLLSNNNLKKLAKMVWNQVLFLEKKRQIESV